MVLVVSSTILKTYANSFNDEKLANVYSAWEDREVYRCGKLFRIFNPRGKICYLESFVGTENLLLVGNSHADSIKGTFQIEA